MASLPCPAPRVLGFTYRHAAKCSVEQKRRTLQCARNLLHSSGSTCPRSSCKLLPMFLTSLHLLQRLYAHLLWVFLRGFSLVLSVASVRPWRAVNTWEEFGLRCCAGNFERYSNGETRVKDTYIHTSTQNIHTYIHTYIHPSIHPSLPPSLHPSIHPYIHTYIHT